MATRTGLLCKLVAHPLSIRNSLGSAPMVLEGNCGIDADGIRRSNQRTTSGGVFALRSKEL